MANEKTPDPETDTKLRLLQAVVEEDSEESRLLLEYIDAANGDEPIDKQELLNRATSTEVRTKLEEDLQFSDVLLNLGKLYREKKRRGEIEE